MVKEFNSLNKTKFTVGNNNYKLNDFIKNNHNTIVMGDFNCYYNGLIDHNPQINNIPKNGTILKDTISNLNLIDLCRFHYKNKNLLNSYLINFINYKINII